MKKNILSVSILFINLILSLGFIFSLNSEQLRTYFSYEKINSFWNNYFFSAIALYYIYICNIEKLIKEKKLSVDKLVKITLVTVFYPVILHEYNNLSEFIIIINLIFILCFYRQIYLLSIVIPLIFILAFCSEQYFNYENQKIYTACQSKSLTSDKVDNCVNEFTFHNFRTETTRYLTPINIKLAKQNEEIKKNIQKKIIQQNEDENCKIDEDYQVMKTKNKRGMPCLG